MRYTVVGIVFSIVLSILLLLGYQLIALILCLVAVGYVIMNIIRWSSLLLVIHDDGIAIDHHYIPRHRIDWYRPIVHNGLDESDYTITWLVLSVDGVPHTFSFVDHHHTRHIIMSLDVLIKRSESYDDTRYDELLRGSKI